MIPDQFALPLLDFMNNLRDVPHLRAAILFGSVAKGEVHKKSDIDILLLFEMRGNPETRREGKIVHRIASEVSKRHQLRHSFSFVMYNVNDIESNEIDFISEVVKDGIGLWIRPDVGVLAKPQSTLRPKTIVSYSLKGLSQKEKMAVHRALYGYRVVKRVGDKEYVNESLGLIEGIGEKLGSGLVMVDMNRAEEVTRVLDECGAEFELRDVWV